MNDDDLRAARLGVMTALGAGDSGLAYRLVLGLMDQGIGLPTILDEVLAPIQRDSGERWVSGDVTVPEEHAITTAVETMVAMLVGAFDQPADADLVVVACAEGEQHTLPARMATALLVYDGYRAIFLGSSVPPADLGSYLSSVEADAVVVSCTRPPNLLAARACVVAAHEVGVPVMLGGRAVAAGEGLWRKLGADGFASSLSQLPELLAAWEPDPAASEAAASEVDGDLDALLRHRAEVAAEVVASLGPGSGDGSTARDEAALELVDALVAAAAFSEGALLAEQAYWVARLSGPREGAEVRPSDALTALADAARPFAPSAAELAASVDLDEG